MVINIKARYNPVYNRNALPIPFEEIRVNPSKKLAWDDLLQTKREMLQAYEIMRTKILSHITPTNLSDLQYELTYNYYFSSNIVSDLIYFITTHETKHIQFDEINGCRKDVVYLKPRTYLSLPIDEYSIWFPNKR